MLRQILGDDIFTSLIIYFCDFDAVDGLFPGYGRYVREFAIFFAWTKSIVSSGV